MSNNRMVKTKLINDIRNEIVRGNYPPGAHLGLDNLAEQFNVSTMPIREALRALEAEGIVYSLPYRGSFVRHFTADELLGIYEMRAVLEQLATRTALPNLIDSQFKQLQDMVDNWHTETEDIVLLVQQNMDFHKLIYQAANRAHLYTEIFLLRHRTHHYLHVYIAEVGRFDQTKQEHQALVDAFKRGDALAAAQLMYDHVWQVGQALADYVRNKENKKF